MNFNDLNQTETELNVAGVEFALNEILNEMGLKTKFEKINPGEADYDKVVYNVYTMDNNAFIGEITLANSEECP